MNKNTPRNKNANNEKKFEWISLKIASWLSVGVFVVFLCLSFLPGWITAGGFTEEIKKEIASNVLLAALAALFFFVAIRAEILRGVLRRHESILGKTESASKDILNQALQTHNLMENTKTEIEEVANRAKKASQEISEISEILGSTEKLQEEESIRRKFTEKMKNLAISWTEIISERKGVERLAWALIFEKYMNEECKDIKSGSPAIPTNYPTYLGLLDGFIAQIVPELEKGGYFPFFYAITNILPVNWFIMEHPDGPYANNYLNKYRKTMGGIAKNKNIKIRRLFLVNKMAENKANRWGIRPKTKLERQMNEYIGFPYETDRLIPKPFPTDKILKILSSENWKGEQLTPGKEGYLITENPLPERTSDGKFYIKGRMRLGKKIMDELHSSREDARYIQATDDDIKNIPREVTDSLIVGYKAQAEAEKKVPIPIIAISCKSFPLEDVILLHIFGGEELKRMREVVRELDENSLPLSSLLR